ncbi:MAG: hypothetical protein WC511_03230 [Candidatus Pacearchaeota archaeon]
MGNTKEVNEALIRVLDKMKKDPDLKKKFDEHKPGWIYWSLLDSGAFPDEDEQIPGQNIKKLK